MQGNLLYRRNPLAFPAGRAPGIDPLHRAAKGLRFSGIAAQKNFLNLTAGTLGVIAATPTFAIDGLIGPSFKCPTGSAKFSGQSTVADPSATFAAIMNFDVTSIQIFFHSSGAGASAQGFMYLVNSTIRCQTGGGEADSLLTPVVGVPYFIVVSANTADINFLLCRLDTGKILTSHANVGASGTPNGTYVVGNYSGGDGPTSSKMAAMMFAANYMTLPEMKVWALDPWAFWYPRQAEMLVAAAAASSFLAAWAQQSNLPVLGTGTY